MTINHLRNTVAALLMLAAPLAFATTAAAPAKTTAPVVAAKPLTNTAGKSADFLFVQNANGMSYAMGKLTLTGVSPLTVMFSDRPDRLAGHMATTEFVPFWSEGKDSFLSNPPNANLSIFAAGKIIDVVVTLSNPVLKGNNLTYDVKILQGKMPAKGELNSLFIDIIGMPLTPVSFAGAARRAVWVR